MIVTIVSVKVKPESVDSFIEATVRNHDASVREAGNMRFDVLQDPNDACAFLLYEAYDGKEASVAHKRTPHYLEWKEGVAGMMAESRQGKPFTVIRPA